MKTLKKRIIDITVLSNINLGSDSCGAEELLTYLSSIEPSIIILIGNTFNFSFKHPNILPSAHLKVLWKFIELSASKTEIICLSGKNDNTVNKIAQQLGLSLRICEKLSFAMAGNKVKFISDLKFDHSATNSLKINRLLLKIQKKGYTHIIGPDDTSSKVWIETDHGKLCLMRSGDWTRTLSALEFAFKRWKIYYYHQDKLKAFYADESLKAMEYHDF